MTEDDKNMTPNGPESTPEETPKADVENTPEPEVKAKNDDLSAALAKRLTPDDNVYKQTLAERHGRGQRYLWLYRTSLVVAVIALVTLLLNVANEAYGTIAVEFEIDPSELADAPLEELNEEQLGAILQDNLPNLLVIIRDNLSRVDASQFTTATMDSILAGMNYDDDMADLGIRDLDKSQHAQLLVDNLSRAQLLAIVESEVVGENILDSWPMTTTLFNYSTIEAQAAENYPDARLEFRSWLNRQFLTVPGSSIPSQAGIRTAILGSLWVISITIVFALPLGVGAAIYLEEYATDNRLNRLIETNIRNLAGVPSIIYGMLGLAIFVRALVFFTSGAFLNPAADTSTLTGRTIISAGLTLGLLILPIIIINGQEAIRAVPQSIREGSYGLGATKWQTIWRQVLPASIPGILTGTILAMSRAVGETAPLIVVGASTVITVDPDGPFARFTVIPIQIFQWTSRPQDQFRDIAAAAIIVLLILLIILNTTAIILRNRYSRKLT